MSMSKYIVIGSAFILVVLCILLPRVLRHEVSTVPTERDCTSFLSQVQTLHGEPVSSVVGKVAVVEGGARKTYPSDTITVSRVAFSNILFSVKTRYVVRPSYTEEPSVIYSAVDKYLYSNTNVLSLSEVFTRLSTDAVMRHACLLIRCKALVPLAEDSVQRWTTNDASEAVTTALLFLEGLEHPDALRALIALDDKLQAVPQLTKMVARSDLPFVERNDCLDVYVDVVQHPERYRGEVWSNARGMLTRFTNDLAVSELKKSGNDAYTRLLLMEQKKNKENSLLTHPTPPPLVDE